METVVNVSGVENSEGRVLRKYFCKVCKNTGEGYTIPLGWFVVRKTVHDVGPKTIGVYDNADCLTIDVVASKLNVSLLHARLLLNSAK